MRAVPYSPPTAPGTNRPYRPPAGPPGAFGRPPVAPLEAQGRPLRLLKTGLGSASAGHSGQRTSLVGMTLPALVVTPYLRLRSRSAPTSPGVTVSCRRSARTACLRCQPAVGHSSSRMPNDVVEEIVARSHACDANGVSDFDRLRSALANTGLAIVLYNFGSSISPRAKNILTSPWFRLLYFVGCAMSGYFLVRLM